MFARLIAEFLQEGFCSWAFAAGLYAWGCFSRGDLHGVHEQVVVIRVQ